MIKWDIYTIFKEAPEEWKNLGSKTFSKDEIIAFAKMNDPLPFHLSESSAKDSFFGKLVCSGGQAFNFFYVHRWIPLFGSSVVGGLGIQNWEFKAPIGVDEEISAQCIIEKMRTSKTNSKLSIVDWRYEFHNKSGNLVQLMNLRVLHRIA